MNKKTLTEANIRINFIAPHPKGAEGDKWNLMTQIREEPYFTRGRVIVRGMTVQRGEAKKADHNRFFQGPCPDEVVVCSKSPPQRGELREPRATPEWRLDKP